jgi:epoxyqueuosine reductase QueG
MGNRLLGCDDCQRVCPCNARARIDARIDALSEETLDIALDALLAFDR